MTRDGLAGASQPLEARGFGAHLVHFDLQMWPSHRNWEQRKVLKIRGNQRAQTGQVGLANRRIQPLCHLSAGGSAEANRLPGLSIALNEGHKGGRFMPGRSVSG